MLYGKALLERYCKRIKSKINNNICYLRFKIKVLTIIVFIRSDKIKELNMYLLYKLKLIKNLIVAYLFIFRNLINKKNNLVDTLKDINMGIDPYSESRKTFKSQLIYNRNLSKIYFKERLLKILKIQNN